MSNSTPVLQRMDLKARKEARARNAIRYLRYLSPGGRATLLIPLREDPPTFAFVGPLAAGVVSATNWKEMGKSITDNLHIHFSRFCIAETALTRVERRGRMHVPYIFVLLQINDGENAYMLRDALHKYGYGASLSSGAQYYVTD